MGVWEGHWSGLVLVLCVGAWEHSDTVGGWELGGWDTGTHMTDTQRQSVATQPGGDKTRKLGQLNNGERDSPLPKTNFVQQPWHGSLNTQHKTLNTYDIVLNGQEIVQNTQDIVRNTQGIVPNTQEIVLSTQDIVTKTRETVLNIQETINKQVRVLKQSCLLKTREDSCGPEVLTIYFRVGPPVS